MNHRARVILACGGIVGMFLLVQLGALALVEPFQEEGFQQIEDTGDPTISVLYMGAILVATGLMLAAIKYGGSGVIRWIIIFASVYISYWVLGVIAPAVLSVSVGGLSLDLFAIGWALAIGAGLVLYPEWYVIDATGILMGIGAAGIFGINFGILPALVLLVVLAVYDAISVYGTEHMLTLASGMMDMRVPVVLIMPLSLSYSFLDSEGPQTLAEPDEQDDTVEDDPETIYSAAELNDRGPDGIEAMDEAELDEALAGLDQEAIEDLDEDVRDAIRDHTGSRDALFIGLGDAVIPTVLVASAAVFVETDPSVSLLGVSATLPALTTMAGILVGLVVLLWMVLKGRAHAGLPLLNGGAILGYLVGAFASGLTLAEALGLSGGLL